MRPYDIVYLALSASAALFPSGLRREAQQPLAGSSLTSSEKSPNSDGPKFCKGLFTRKAHDGTACKTSGEKQWTGTIDVTNERRLFYWFFDSQNDPANDDIIIWLNGGPGATSMRGLFTEVGPCLINPGENGTRLNPYSWNLNASLLVIDQPAGVGFSQVKPGGTYAADDTEAARDLQTFLRLFFGAAFPDRSHAKIHFAGESYGGHYVPTTVKFILDAREAASPAAFWGNITSMVLVNSLIAEEQTPIGFYELFCTDYRGHIWDRDVCQEMAQSIPELERRALKCNAQQDGEACDALSTFASDRIDYLYSQVLAGKLNWYNIQKPCPHPTICEPDTMGNFTKYLSRPEILQSLGFPPDFVFDAGGLTAGKTIGGSTERYLPMSDKVAAILDAATIYNHRQGQADIRLFILNGSEDSLCSTPGTKIIYERLAWNGAAGYRAQQWKPFTDLGLRKGTGEWKNDEKGQLLFVAVNDAGHMVPMDQPEIADWLIQKWIVGEI